MTEFRTTMPWPVKQEDLPDIEIKWTDEDDMEGSDFDHGAALAALLAAGQININGFLECPNEEKWHIGVTCSDVFAWGCADVEDLPYSELENCFRMWREGEE